MCTFLSCPAAATIPVKTSSITAFLSLRCRKALVLSLQHLNTASYCLHYKASESLLSSCSPPFRCVILSQNPTVKQLKFVQICSVWRVKVAGWDRVIFPGQSGISTGCMEEVTFNQLYKFKNEF